MVICFGTLNKKSRNLPSFLWRKLNVFHNIARAEGRPRLVESSQDEDEDEESNKTEVAQKVGVRFLKGGGAENDKALEMKKKSFEYQQKIANEEPWLPTDYHHVKSEKWVEETQKLFCRHLDGEAIGGDVKVDEYLQQLRE